MRQAPRSRRGRRSGARRSLVSAGVGVTSATGAFRPSRTITATVVQPAVAAMSAMIATRGQWRHWLLPGPPPGAGSPGTDPSSRSPAPGATAFHAAARHLRSTGPAPAGHVMRQGTRLAPLAGSATFMSVSGRYVWDAPEDRTERHPKRSARTTDHVDHRTADGDRVRPRPCARGCDPAPSISRTPPRRRDLLSPPRRLVRRRPTPGRPSDAGPRPVRRPRSGRRSASRSR